MGLKCSASHSHLVLAEDWKSPNWRVNTVIISSQLSFLVSSILLTLGLRFLLQCVETGGFLLFH